MDWYFWISAIVSGFLINFLTLLIWTGLKKHRGVVDETDAEMNAADKWRERGE